MKKRTSTLGLKKPLKLGASRKQTLLVLAGLVVAVGAGIGVYSQYQASHAAGYGNWKYIGTDNSYGEGMSAWACQTGAYNNSNTVKAHYEVAHSRAYNHTYYGGIENHDANLPSNYAYSWAWSGGTTVSGFQTLNTSIRVNSNHNNYLVFYASYGSRPAVGGYSPIGGGTYRPSALPYCS